MCTDRKGVVTMAISSKKKNKNVRKRITEKANILNEFVCFFLYNVLIEENRWND